MTVAWSAPSANGSPIIAYKIEIRESDLVTYTESLSDCDGEMTAIVEARSCEVTVSTLMQAYGLTPGTSVFAKITAVNAMGTSSISTQGNGATLKLSVTPDAPVNLARDELNTWAGQITINWEEGAENGG